MDKYRDLVLIKALYGQNTHIFSVDSKVNYKHNFVKAATPHISEYRNISFHACGYKRNR